MSTTDELVERLTISTAELLKGAAALEACQARAEKAEDAIEHLRADLVVIKQAFLEERAKRGKDAHEIERLKAELANEVDLSAMRLQRIQKDEAEIERLRRADSEYEFLVRNDALEEAAKVADDFAQHKRDTPDDRNVHELTAIDIAASILALKDKHD